VNIIKKKIIAVIIFVQTIFVFLIGGSGGGSRLLHPIHGRGVFQHSNIISNLTVPRANRGSRGSLPLALGEPPEAFARAFTRRRMKTDTNELRSI